MNSTNVERLFMAMFRFSEDSGLVWFGVVGCCRVVFGGVMLGTIWFGDVRYVAVKLGLVW